MAFFASDLTKWYCSRSKWLFCDLVLYNNSTYYFQNKNLFFLIFSINLTYKQNINTFLSYFYRSKWKIYLFCQFPFFSGVNLVLSQALIGCGGDFFSFQLCPLLSENSEKVHQCQFQWWHFRQDGSILGTVSRLWTSESYLDMKARALYTLYILEQQALSVCFLLRWNGWNWFIG